MEIMETSSSFSRPLLRTKGFSTLHIYIFELILLDKTNREINKLLGYSQRSHMVVDHSKLVMHKLLCCESLCKKEYSDQVIYPRKYMFWWKKLLDKHYDKIQVKAIKPQYYEEKDFTNLL